MSTKSLFVLGQARSGTTWLAKIFDSHPGVLYRHEPDIPYPKVDLPVFCLPDQVDRYLPAARECLRLLADTRHVRCAGTPPLFEKNYMNKIQKLCRSSLIYAVKSFEKMSGQHSIFQKIAIPDFAEWPSDSSVTLVIKSVISMGRVNLIHAAMPKSKLIVIIRHPCGYVTSHLRGMKREGTEVKPGAGLPATDQARRRGLTSAVLDGMTTLERLAWVWAIFNEKAMEDLSGVAEAKVIRYEDLCDSPVETSQALFEFAGLSWDSQTADFIARSTSHKGKAGYYSILRDSKSEIEKWKAELSSEDINTITDIVRESLPGRLYA